MFIGPACRDVNIDFDGSIDRGIGGAVYFCSFAARAVGADVMNAVKINPEDTDVRDAFETDRDHIRILPSRLTTKMKNVYTTPTRETRDASCEAQSDPILPEEIPEDSCTIYHLAGLLYGDFPERLIPYLAKRGQLSADIQGFLRHNDNGPMNFRDWDQKETFLKYFDFLKTDAAEAKILTGSDDRREAAKIMHDMGAGEILITHSTRHLVHLPDPCPQPFRENRARRYDDGRLPGMPGEEPADTRRASVRHSRGIAEDGTAGTDPRGQSGDSVVY